MTEPNDMRDERMDLIDPRMTEACLLGQPEVVDARVFWVDGFLEARVTLTDESEWTPRKIKAYVCETLGLHQTPRNVVCSVARMRAA